MSRARSKSKLCLQLAKLNLSDLDSARSIRSTVLSETESESSLSCAGHFEHPDDL